MKKLLTILLALCMVLSLSGAVIADTPGSSTVEISYNGGEESWTIEISPAGIIELGESGATGTVTVSGMWLPSKTLSVTVPETLDMTEKVNTANKYPVAVTSSSISKAGSYYSTSTVTGSFTVDPEGKMSKEVNVGTWTGSLTFTVETTDVPVLAPKTVEDLKTAFEMAASQDSGDMVITLNDDFDVNNGWEAFTPKGYNGVNQITINGNGHTIKNLNEPLMVGSFAGAGSVTINDLTIENANIAGEGYNGLGLGAFVAYSDASGTLILNNCHLKDSTVICTSEATITTPNVAGGLVGYSSSDIKITECSVTGSTIESNGESAGAIIGQDAAQGLMDTIKVSDCTIKATYAGTIVGTSNEKASTYSNVETSGCTVTPTTDGSDGYYGRAFVGLSINGTEYVQ